MSSLLVDSKVPVTYVDRRQLLRSRMSEAAFTAVQQGLQDCSTTLYVGNLAYHTREPQVFQHFSPFGHIRDIVMGLSDGGITTATTTSAAATGAPKKPCGFCFVVYESRAAAVAAWAALHHSIMDDRVIHVSWDVGLSPTPATVQGSASSSSSSSQQQQQQRSAAVVDSIRHTSDDGRGGLGALRKAALGLSSTTTSAGSVGTLLPTPTPTSSGAAVLLRAVQQWRHDGEKGMSMYRTVVNAANSGSMGEVDGGEDAVVDYYWVRGPKRRRPAPNRENNRFRQPPPPQKARRQPLKRGRTVQLSEKEEKELKSQKSGLPKNFLGAVGDLTRSDLYIRLPPQLERVVLTHRDGVWMRGSCCPRRKSEANSLPFGTQKKETKNQKNLGSYKDITLLYYDYYYYYYYYY
eukprot:gene11656-8039_t